MARTQNASLLILPLPKGNVLLPGVVQRIPASPSRPDILALLGNVFKRAKSKSPNGRPDAVPIACVPMASPYLGPQGQLLLNRDESGRFDAIDTPEFDPETTSKSDLFSCGVAAKITGIEGRGTAEFALLVEGQARLRIEKIHTERPYFEGKVSWYHDDINITDMALEELSQQLKQLSRELVSLLRVSALLSSRHSSTKLTPLLARRLDLFISRKTIGEVGSLADFMANIVESSYEEKLQVLALFNVKERVAKVVKLLERQIGSIKDNVKITTITTTTLPFTIEPDPRQQDENQVWNPFKQGGQGRNPPMPFGTFMPTTGFRGSPGAGNPPDEQGPSELDELQKKLEAANLSPEAAKVAEKEIKRLKTMMPMQSEYAVTVNYLETLADIPWSATTDDQLGPGTLPRARKQLDDDHYGLEKVKKRLLEYLAVLRLKQSINNEVGVQIEQTEKDMMAFDPSEDAKAPKSTDNSDARDKREAANARLEILKSKRMVDKSPILLLVGPPGVGKTSLARSVATALGRKFHRISLGGVRDEAEIRGHRRTYVAAMPGLIVQGLRKVGVANPVFLLDEIDKIGTSNFQGDPSAAMLEVLDPEQNNSFVDHYISIPYDLSRVLFIATANSLDTIPAPLLDRMEMIYLPGYTTLEKRHIAMQHLVPKQIRTNGLAEDQVTFSPEVVSKIIESYTRESGVRNLEREIGSVCRAKAVEFADAKDEGKLQKYQPQLTVDDIERILGIEKFEEEIAEKSSRPGIVTGLVAYSSGGNGSILFIEVADMPGTGSVQLTGKLGSVLKESVEVALSWVKAHAYELGLAQDPTENIMKNRSIHVHCPSGSIPKDGPSSGIAQAIALISLFSGKAVSPELAMTGEISLRGRITAVGGIKEKLIGALRAGVKTVLLPAQNRKDVKDLPQEVKDGLEIRHVSHVWEAIRHVWPDAHFPGEQHYGIESRL